MTKATNLASFYLFSFAQLAERYSNSTNTPLETNDLDNELAFP